MISLAAASEQINSNKIILISITHSLTILDCTYSRRRSMSFLYSPDAIGQQTPRQQQQRQRQQQQQQQQRRTTDFMMSKSLGDTFDFFGNRPVGDINSRNLSDDQDSSKIMYSGYLLKGSNHSCPASTILRMVPSATPRQQGQQ